MFWNARIKGKLKIDEDISSTNPVAVGDTVSFDMEDEDLLKGMITAVADRHNYMVRVSPHNKNQKHIIAADIDLALLVASIADPRTSTGFIDRFLVTAEAYHIPAILVVNKTDLRGREEYTHQPTDTRCGYTHQRGLGLERQGAAHHYIRRDV